MRKWMAGSLMVVVAAIVLALPMPAVGGTMQLLPGPEFGGACGCSGTTPVCCPDCNGNFAYCARSHAFCPECPAP